MNSIFEALPIACIYIAIIFVPLCAMELFAAHTRLGRRIMDKLFKRMHVLDDEPNYVIFSIDSRDIKVNLDTMSLTDLKKLSSWVEESISKK